MEPPVQITPKKLGDYLEVLTKAVFESGISWAVIENKWSGFQEAFVSFDADAVADFTPDDVDRLSQDTRIVRNRRKIEATIWNAQTMKALEGEFGGFKKYLGSHADYDALVKDMKKRFKFVGDFGSFYFLYVVQEPVPEYHEFRTKLLESGKGSKARANTH